MTAGESFVKMIRPAGAALFLLLGVLVTVFCFTGGRDPIPGYEAPESAAYYARHLDELQAELESKVFPVVGGVGSSEITGDVLTVYLEKDRFAVTRGAILRYFDKSLFVFAEGQNAE